ncbi:MAG: hypothetical protein V9F00_02230 [Nocardioides sp.]
MGGLHTVDDDFEGAAEADADQIAVDDRGIERRVDQVVFADRDVLVLQHLAHGVAHGDHLARLSVDGQSDRPAEGAIGIGSDDQRQGQCAHQHQAPPARAGDQIVGSEARRAH